MVEAIEPLKKATNWIPKRAGLYLLGVHGADPLFTRPVAARSSDANRPERLKRTKGHRPGSERPWVRKPSRAWSSAPTIDRRHRDKVGNKKKKP